MKKMTNKSKENLFLVINLILAVLTMALVLSLTGRILDKDEEHVSLFLGFSILSQVIFQCLLFAIHKGKKDRLRIIFIGLIYIAAMISAFSAKNNYIMFFVSNSLVVIAMSLNQFLLVGKEKTKTGVITNILLGITLAALSVAVMVNIEKENAILISMVTVILFLFGSLRKILFPSLRLEKIRLLVDILIKTHTIDVLICLVSFMIAFSFMFPMVEENITNFWDAMWYCFTVITTIGFGDFYATSLVGRILTVILGIYGIVVVAILTSVIVNFYNEVSAKEKARDIIE